MEKLRLSKLDLLKLFVINQAWIMMKPFQVAMLKSIQILLTTATYHDYDIWRLGVMTAFLNDDLEESVYKYTARGLRR